MQRTLSSSYGKPFISTLQRERERERDEASMLTCYPSGNYTPPKCDFDTVRMNLTVTSRGRQFDRLGLMYLGDSEMFRTSTAEPTADGIVWSYIKDVIAYNALWKEPQKLIFDLGNTVTDVYTGSFNMTLTATFSQQGNTARMRSCRYPRRSQGRMPRVLLPSPRMMPGCLTSCLRRPRALSWLSLRVSRRLRSSGGQMSSRRIRWRSVTPLVNLMGIIRSARSSSISTTLWLVLSGPSLLFSLAVFPRVSWRPIVGIDASDLRQPEIDISPFLPVLAASVSPRILLILGPCLCTRGNGAMRIHQAGDDGSSLSFGDTSQVFAGEAAGVSYHRSVRATNGSVVYDGD